MKVVLFGGSGATGGHFIRQALEAGHEVTALVRDAARLKVQDPRVKVIVGDATKLADVEKALAGQDAAVSVLGPRSKKDAVRSAAARNIVTAMKTQNVGRVVWVSLAGAGDSHEQMKRSSFVFSRIIMPLFMKHAFEDAVVAEDLLRKSEKEWVIVRLVQLTDGASKAGVTAVTGDAPLAGLKVSSSNVAQFLLEQASNPTFARKSPVIHDAAH